MISDENINWLNVLPWRHKKKLLKDYYKIIKHFTAKSFLKSKVYLKPQEKPPEGVRVQRGPRGGTYYEEHISIKKPVVTPVKTEPIQPVKLDIEYTKDPELLKEQLFVNFITDFKEAKNLPNQLEILSDYKRTFDRNLESEVYNKVQKIHRAIYRHIKYVVRQYELAKIGKAHIDVKLFKHKIKIFEKVEPSSESLNSVSTIRNSVRIDTGCNSTIKIQFSNDIMINALFKSKKGEYKDIRRGIKTQYNREVCVYELDQLFKLNLVPETVYKTVDGEIGSAQKWISHTIHPGFVPPEQRIDVEISRAKIFDYLISNTDRHQGNFLFKENHLILIDHGCAFSSIDASEMRTFQNMIIGEDFDESKVVEQFISVPWEDIEKILKRHKIPKEAQEICKKKFTLLKNEKRFPTKKELHKIFPDEYAYIDKND